MDKILVTSNIFGCFYLQRHKYYAIYNNSSCPKCYSRLFIKRKEDSFKCYICHDFYYVINYNTLYPVIPLEICVI